MAIAIVDYGAGNIVNVMNALAKLGELAVVVSTPDELKKADALILPGVGSFGSAMARLTPLKEPLVAAIDSGIPFLGICLGMQLLFETSAESPSVRGLGILAGKVKRFDSSFGLPIPQMGWNKVEPILESGRGCPFIPKSIYAYFVHSYYCEPEDTEITCAVTDYGKQFTSAIWKGNVFATQFHPEKSGKVGLELLRAFLKEVKA